MKNGSIVSSAFEDYVYDGNDSSEGYDKHENRYGGSYSVSTFSLVLVMVLALGLVGNSAFVYVTLKVPSMRTVLNIYLINLCVADTLFLVTGIPLELYFIHMEEVNEKILRFFHSVFSVIPQFAGLFIVALVSVERYVGICHPFKARYFHTKNRVRISVMVCWLAGLLMSLPHTMNSIVVSTDLFTAILICEILTFVVSMCTVFILYTMIICKLRRDEQVHAKTKSAALKDRRQVTVLLVVTTSIFFVCVSPEYIIYFEMTLCSLDAKSDDTEPYVTFKMLAKTLLFLNSAVNTLIYNVTCARYREAFWKAFRGWKRERENLSAHGDGMIALSSEITTVM